MRFVDETGQRTMREAIEAIEAKSSIEVVVSVRPRLRRWPSANAAVGATFAIAALAFTLFADIEFELWEILVLPWLAGMLGGLAVELVPPVSRALTPPRVRRDNLVEAARATFYELGVSRTRGRTGVLVFVALRERAATLVGDLGVIDAVGQRALDRIAAEIANAIPDGATAVAKALSSHADDLGAALPRADDDIDELPNEVHVARPRARGRVAP